MHLLTLLLLTALVTGCATLPPPHPDHVQCDKVANYARGIEVLKQVGVTQVDTSEYVSQPSVAYFPMRRVRSLVYLTEFETPAETYAYFYNMCVKAGYGNLLTSLKHDEGKHTRFLQMDTAPLRIKRIKK